MKNALIAMVALLSCACSGNRFDEVSKLMATCYDDLQFHARPFSCEDALREYRELDVERLEPMQRVELRMQEGAIAHRMRTGE